MKNIFKKKPVVVQPKPNPVANFGRSVAALVATHYVIRGIDNGVNWVAERAATWRAVQAEKAEARMQAEASAAEAVSDFESAFASGDLTEDEATRTFLETFAKANGVKNTHSMKFETLVARCNEIRESLQAEQAAPA